MELESLELKRQRIAKMLRLAGLDDAGAVELAHQVADLTLEPNLQKAALAEALNLKSDEVIVTGPVGQRLILVSDGPERWLAATPILPSLNELPIPPAVAVHLDLLDPQEPVCRARINAEGRFRLLRPRVLIAALYHPENFPLPRFALGISDLARAVRSGYSGEVQLIDMQLGATAEEVADLFEQFNPDVFGISATFGQHDVLEHVIDLVDKRVQLDCQVMFGGSLAVLNEAALLREFPGSILARSAGEPTIIDMVAHWHGDLAKHQIRNAAFTQDDLLQITRRVASRDYESILPELDLLRPTLARGGIMQLESSRGCTHACSFCPREHKGVWRGDDPSRLANLLDEIGSEFRRHPDTSRRVFLVDEEFIGHDRAGEALERASGVADALDKRGFTWETSSRVDQVSRPEKDRAWHVKRIRTWMYLRDSGLDRCLFGVESGVDSILERFNKRVTGEQNVQAIRTLTALGVPIRCTYITFDQLMTLDELVATYQFQGRRDLNLRPFHIDDPDDFWEALSDPRFVEEHLADQPFYRHISYMLVSMECLVNSPYLRKVEEAGLARELLPSMGRRNADFRDPRLGLLSSWSQRWVDRTFSFDYTLKSLEKVTSGDEKAAVRSVRQTLKESAHILLGRMLHLCTLDGRLLAHAELDHTGFLDKFRDDYIERVTSETDDLVRAVVEDQFLELLLSVTEPLDRLRLSLAPSRLPVLEREFQVWSTRSGWDFINSPEQCVS